MVWDRSQARLRQRNGWDLSAPDAVDRARALVAEHPGDAPARLVLASALSQAGDQAGGLAAARHAVELEPDSARAATGLAALLMATDPVAALAEARRAAQLDPADPHVLYNLGLAEHAAGRREEARRALFEAGSALGVELRPWWRRPRRRGRSKPA